MVSRRSFFRISGTLAAGVAVVPLVSEAENVTEASSLPAPIAALPSFAGKVRRSAMMSGGRGLSGQKS